MLCSVRSVRHLTLIKEYVSCVRKGVSLTKGCALLVGRIVNSALMRRVVACVELRRSLMGRAALSAPPVLLLTPQPKPALPVSAPLVNSSPLAPNNATGAVISASSAITHFRARSVKHPLYSTHRVCVKHLKKTCRISALKKACA